MQNKKPYKWFLYLKESIKVDIWNLLIHLDILPLYQMSSTTIIRYFEKKMKFVINYFILLEVNFLVNFFIPLRNFG